MRSGDIEPEREALDSAQEPMRVLGPLHGSPHVFPHFTDAECKEMQRRLAYVEAKYPKKKWRRLSHRKRAAIPDLWDADFWEKVK
jgi:hypothetical protein